jgi:hypothetical protein
MSDNQQPTKMWANLTERERRLMSLINGTSCAMNLIANEIDGGDNIENMPGGRAAVRAMERLKKELERFCPEDNREDESEPEAERRAAEERAIWAEVSP